MRRALAALDDGTGHGASARLASHREQACSCVGGRKMRRKLEIRKAPQRSAEVAQSVTEGAEVGFPELRVGGQGLDAYSLSDLGHPKRL